MPPDLVDRRHAGLIVFSILQIMTTLSYWPCLAVKCRSASRPRGGRGLRSTCLWSVDQRPARGNWLSQESHRAESAEGFDAGRIVRQFDRGGIIDPAKVVRIALKSAVSAASMLHFSLGPQ